MPEIINRMSFLEKITTHSKPNIQQLKFSSRYAGEILLKNLFILVSKDIPLVKLL